MRSFRSRLKYYLFGLGLGSIFVFFVFGNRGCSWLPNNRIKNMIAEKEILVGDSIWQVMKCKNITPDYIYDLLNKSGSVEFSKSNPQAKPKIYHLNGDYYGHEFAAKFALGDSTVELLNVFKAGDACKVSVSNANKSTLPIPKHELINILESKSFRILDKAKCQIEKIGATEQEFLDFHKVANIDMKKSAPRKKGTPYYTLVGQLNNETISVRYEIAESRTRIAEIIGIEGCE